MLPVYLFCLVLGGGFALLSAFGGFFHADAGLHLDADVHLDMDGHLLGAAEAIDVDHGAEVGHVAAIFSLRSLVYSLFGFGATGTLLTVLGSAAGGWLTVGLSIVAGVAVGVAVGSLLAYLRRSDSQSRVGDEGFVGLPARVTLAIRDGSPGRILVSRGGREHAVRALPFSAESAGEAERWERVVVLEMRDGIAYVDPLEGEGVDLIGPGP